MCDGMTPGLVSTIIPVYNRPEQLREAVASVLAQDYEAIEIIIVDDASTDGVTYEVAQQLCSTNRCKVQAVTQVNGGPGIAREHGRQLAQGEFIQYLDSDDILLPGKFTAQVAALRDKPEADVAYGITYFRDHAGVLHREPHKDTGVERETMFPSFLNSRWWETATPMYRATVCEKAGPWTNLRLEEDWEYDCRIAALGGRLAYCAIPVSEHRDHIGDRLSRGSALDTGRQKERAIAEALIFKHAKTFGLTPHVPEMQTFARSLFLLSRQCGVVGLSAESEHLFKLSQQAAGPLNSRRGDYKIYWAATKVVGWKWAGRLAVIVERCKQ